MTAICKLISGSKTLDMNDSQFGRVIERFETETSGNIAVIPMYSDELRQVVQVIGPARQMILIYGCMHLVKDNADLITILAQLAKKGRYGKPSDLQIKADVLDKTSAIVHLEHFSWQISDNMYKYSLRLKVKTPDKKQV